VKVAPFPSNEVERLRVLYDLDVLDTAPEPAYDDLTEIAALTTRRPTALVSLVDADRQWFKSRWGLDFTETPRDFALCAHAILNPDDVLIVNDTLDDERFADNPLVTGEPRIRFYAGAPLVTTTGEALGTLCVLDTEPGELSDDQLAALQALARRTIDQLEQRQADLTRLRTDLADALHHITMLEASAVRQAAERAVVTGEHALGGALIEQVTEGVAVCTVVPQHPFLEFSVWNDRMADITGFGIAEINRLGWFPCLYGDSAARSEAIERMERTERGEDLRIERSRISRPDGTERIIGLTTSRLSNEHGAAKVLIVANDITAEEKFAREAMRGRQDELTGLHTRHAFRNEAELLFRLASRTGSPSALGFIDVDNLKLVNDTMGHAAGDRLISLIGSTLTASTRATDVVGRLGGDELAVLLPDTETDHVPAYFERLHARLLDALRAGGWPAGVSIGAASFPAAPPSLDAALNYADDLMYQAKRAGKNRVVHAGFAGIDPAIERRLKETT
jgi:diguanylate cyclase (GGDEF)-like protein/PAS domain S-box-containing protein